MVLSPPHRTLQPPSWAPSRTPSWRCRDPSESDHRHHLHGHRQDTRSRRRTSRPPRPAAASGSSSSSSSLTPTDDDLDEDGDSDAPPTMGHGASRSALIHHRATRPQCVELRGTRQANHGGIRRTTVPLHLPPSPMTLYTSLHERRRVDGGTRPIYGWRRRDPETNEAGEYVWVTFAEFLEQVEHMSAAMALELGLTRQEPVGIFSKNRYEWVLVEHGCHRMAYSLVPLYDTLGSSAIPYILNQTEMRVIFCGKQQFSALLGSLDESPTVKIIVQFEDVEYRQRQAAAAKRVELRSLRELLAIGKAKPVAADPPVPSDVVTISYTSGTTGSPKGVVLTHANAIAAAACVQALNPVTGDDVHLSYLPLAHVLERGAHTMILRLGGCVGFFQGDVTKLLDDLATLRPTIFLSVPRLFNRIHDRILQGVQSKKGVKSWLFNLAYGTKRGGLANGTLQHPFWDKVVFSKVQRLLGGRVRLLVNGSAPLSRDCKEFLQIAFACPVVEGYGMTETYAAISFSTPAIAPGDHVGVPAPGMEIRLTDVPDMSYTSDDVPCPRGEICVRGPNMFSGYYKDPIRTAEVLDKDGWLHTGDIGQWNSDGTLSIIDRKKNIFKLAQGEYVAPEKIENIYIKSPLVAQIFVHGDSTQSFLVCVIIPDPEAVSVWAMLNGYPSDEPLQELCKSSALKEDVLIELDALAAKYRLLEFEHIRDVFLHHQTWTAENNLVTPTFKLKRANLAKYYAREIRAMYNPVAW